MPAKSRKKASKKILPKQPQKIVVCPKTITNLNELHSIFQFIHKKHVVASKDIIYFLDINKIEIHTLANNLTHFFIYLVQRASYSLVKRYYQFPRYYLATELIGLVERVSIYIQNILQNELEEYSPSLH